jgi:WD40 repeat protein
MRRAVFLVLLSLAAATVAAEQITTTPLQFYGLGTVTCGAWSSDGTKLVTGGSAGAFLWDLSTVRVTRIFAGHRSDVVSVAFSPDGTEVLTGSLDSTARLWRVSDGTTMRVFSGHTDAVNSVAFSPDGSKILTGSTDDSARLWNAADGSLVTAFWGHNGEVRSVAYSPLRTRVLTGSYDGTAKVWNAATGQLVRTFNCQTSVTAVAFSPLDGAKVVTGSGRTTRLWNVGDGSLLWTRTWGAQIAGVSSLSYASDGTSIAIGASDGWVVLRNADTGTTRSFILVGSGPIASITFSPDAGALLTAVGAPENTPKIWFPNQTSPDVVYRGHTAAVSSVAFSPDGSGVLTGSSDRTAKVWNTNDGAPLRTFSGHTDEVLSVAFSPSGDEILTGSKDRTAKLWNSWTAALIRSFLGHTNWVSSVAFSLDGISILTGSWDKTAKLWNASGGAATRTFAGHAQEVRGVAFSPDATKVLTGCGDGKAALWNATDGTTVGMFIGHAGGVNAVAWSPDGASVLTGSGDRTARLWNVSGGPAVRTFSGHTGDVTSVASSPDGTKVLTGSYDRTARLWNASDGTVIRTFFGHTDQVLAVAFSPDGKRVLTGSRDRTARLWPPDGDTLAGHTAAVTAVAVAGDQATTTATGHDDNIARTWNAANGVLLQTFSGHRATINGVALSPDGALLLTGSNDRTAKLWNAADGQVLRNFTGHDGPVNAVAFSPDGTKYVTAGGDGWALLWRTSDGTPAGSFAHGDAILGVAFSHDGTKILTGGDDNTAQLWDAATGAKIRTFSGHTNSVRAVAVSRDGTKILTGSDDLSVRLWNAATGALIRTFSGLSDLPVFVAFSPDATAIVVASDREAKFWNASNGSLLRTLQGHTEALTAAALCGDGSRLVTGSEDGTARLWTAFAAGAAGGPALAGDKFILVAGGGNYVGNPIVAQTQALADRAFFACLVRGYRRSEIRYVSAFNDWNTRDSNNDGLPDADTQATTQTFWSAIDTWSSGTARLFLYLVDHGSYNSQTGEWSFRLNATQYVKATDLDSHLDALQTQTGCEVILIVDCCFSGGFVQKCKAPAGKRRVVISSTTPQDLAIYSPPAGAESFSFYFFSFAIQGNTLEDCVKWTKLSFASMGNPGGQTPWMDDNNDGVSSKLDGALAAQHVLGRYPAFGLNAPTILDVASTQSVYVRDRVTLWARLDAAVAAKEVWVIVVSPRASYASGEPVTNLPRVNLAFSPSLNRWQAVWSPQLEHSGQCTVTYFAVSEDPLGTRLVATPKSSGLRVLSPTAVRIPWELFR